MRKKLRLNLVVGLSTFLLAGLIVARTESSTQDDVLVKPEKSKTIKDSNFDWPGFLGPRRDGRSTESGIMKDWSNGNLQILWRRRLGTGYSLGSTANGRYYQLDAKESKCRLFCLDEKTGTEIWDFSYDFKYEDMYGYGEGPRSTPLIDDGRVFIYGVTGMLHCLDAATGSLIWKLDMQTKFGVIQNFFGVGSSPIVSDDYLIVMVGGSPETDKAKGRRLDEATPNSTGLVVLEKRTGKVVHKLVDDLASYASINLYQDSGSTRAVAWMRENLVGIDIEKGTQLWSFPFRARKYESVNASTPVVRGTQILISESYGPGTVVLDVKDAKPKVIWKDQNIRNRSLATHWNTPVFHKGHIFACNGERRGNTDIRCVEWQSGRVKWKKTGYSRSSLTYIDEHFVVLAESGELFLIKADNESFQLVSTYSGENGKRLPLKQPCWAAPVISNGRLFVRGKDELICLKLIDGAR